MNPNIPRNAKTIICNHVFEAKRDVLYAYFEDDTIGLMCGRTDHAQSADEYKVVGVGHLLDRDPSISAGLQLAFPDGAVDRNSTDESWQVTDNSPA